MLTLVLLWLGVALAFVVLYATRPGKKAGLVLAYVLVLFINYWVGAAIYVLPKFVPTHDPRLTYLGLQQTFYALLAFSAGSLILAPRFTAPAAVTRGQHERSLTSTRTAYAFLVIGAVSYTALSTRLSSLPSATSMAAVGQELFVVGLCLLVYKAWNERAWARFFPLLGSSALLPLITVIAHGFLIYGAIAMFAVMSFVGTFTRPRSVVIAAGCVIGFLSLSLFVTYIRDRTELRSSIWGGAAAPTRVAQVNKTLSRFELFSASNLRHLRAIDTRLNLAGLTGLAVHRLTFTGDYAHGTTLLKAAEAVVPRVLWPGKPEAGGNAVVEQYTGLQFTKSTSVGAGPVMELYINFGETGVVVGFLIVGTLVAVFDERAGLHLAAGDEASFALFFILGLSMLQVGGSFIDVASTAAASLVFMAIIRRTVVPPSAIGPDPAELLALTSS